MGCVRGIPEGVPVVMPMLVCADAEAEIDFCKATFGAVELVRRPGPDGVVADAAFAVVAGARVLLPVTNQFWGDRTARIVDPAGHVWTISTRIEEISSAQREERWSKIVKG
jgi:PhnB protein